LQKTFGKLLADKADSTNDLRLQRIAGLLQDAEASKGPLSKFRRSHLYYHIPIRRLDEWLEPFFAKLES
jgi:hypothetical protein